MSAYINRVGSKYQVIEYNSLYNHNSSKTRHLGTFSTQEEAEKLVNSINKKEELKYTMPKKTIEEWAKMHQTKETLQEIANKFKVPLKYVKKQLQEFSRNTDWYDYWHAREHLPNADKHRINVNDDITASVYTTFIETMKSLGKTTSEAWLEIYKIRGEVPPDFQEVKNEY